MMYSQPFNFLTFLAVTFGVSTPNSILYVGEEKRINQFVWRTSNSNNTEVKKESSNKVLNAF